MSVTNTSKLDPLILLMTTMGAGGIEAQEAQGQRELVRSDVLPSDMRVYGDGEKNAKTRLEAMGVVFGAPVKGDPIFISVTLPKGWKKEATDHDMWSKLLNEEGEEVASIFYKAAFYDRSAFLSLKSDR